MEKKKQLIFLEDSKGIVRTKYKTGNLYILSDEEIKEGDSVLLSNNSIVKAVVGRSDLDTIIGFNTEKGNVVKRFSKLDKKIIATTNEFLKIEVSRGFIGKEYQLPEPSKSFIDVFVREYNKGNIITDVMVEYEEIKYNSSGVPVTWSSESNLQVIQRLKINSKDSTITIKKVKNSWTKEELMEEYKKLLLKAKSFSSGPHISLEDINTWIENL